MPSLKVTVPVGVPGKLLVTVAVKVTLCPKTDGFTDEVTVVDVLSRVTVWVMAGEVVLLKLLSPE
jgi:hypothetical protein